MPCRYDLQLSKKLLDSITRGAWTPIAPRRSNPRSEQQPALRFPHGRPAPRASHPAAAAPSRNCENSSSRAQCALGRRRRLAACAMAPLRFAANLAWLFQEEPALLQRIEAASRAGFRAVELGFPYACSAPELRAAAERDGLEVVLLNTPPGNQEKGDRGLGAVPGRQPEFREALALAVKYAKELKCPRIHLMAGRFPTGAKRDAVSTEMEATFIENLRYAADILEQENLTGLLEPINNQISDPNYFLTTPQQAAAILEKVGSPSLKLQLDIFHCQIMNGNLTQNLKAYFPIIGHIQIAQVPGRHEPDSPGELNFPYLFQLLESMSYSGYIGCEYKPKGNTLDGLNWLYSYWEDHCVGKVGKKLK